MMDYMDVHNHSERNLNDDESKSCALVETSNITTGSSIHT